MEHANTASQNPDELRLSGRLTISEARDLYELIKRKLAESHNVCVNIEQVSEIDLTCLQLLCSAHRTFQSLGRTFVLSGSIPLAIQHTLTAIGFTREQGCIFNSGQDCLWVSLK